MRSIDTENEDVIHRNMNVNKSEKNQDTLEEIVYECTDYTSPAVMEDGVKEELEDGNQNDLIDKNEIEVNDLVGEISIETENRDTIHRNMNVNKSEINMHTLEEVIY